jgi:hypothetical protein
MFGGFALQIVSKHDLNQNISQTARFSSKKRKPYHFSLSLLPPRNDLSSSLMSVEIATMTGGMPIKVQDFMRTSRISDDAFAAPSESPSKT